MNRFLRTAATFTKLRPSVAISIVVGCVVTVVAVMVLRYTLHIRWTSGELSMSPPTTERETPVPPGTALPPPPSLSR